jgi:hypothetical protein
MKKLLIYIILIFAYKIAFSDIENCDYKYKQRDNRLRCKFRNHIKKQENGDKFVPYCYKDGFIKGKQKYSVGYGSAEGFYNSNWCEELYSKLVHKSPRLARLKKEIVMRQYIDITKQEADNRLDKDVMGFYGKLSYLFYKKTNQKIDKALNDNQIISIVDKLYREGETIFNAGYIWTFLAKFPNYTTNDLLKAFKISSKEKAGARARALQQMLLFNEKYFIDSHTINKNFTY